MTASLHKLYLSEVKEEKRKFPEQATEVITEQDIKFLPEPVKRFFETGGYLGRPKHSRAFIRWEKAALRFSPNQAAKAIECYQFNSVPEPCRIVYMKSRVFGFLPFAGRDKYQNGQGNMLIKLLDLFTIQDVKGPEMNASALVTVLAEAFLVPSYALQNYIVWTPLNSRSAQAAIAFKGTEISGIFYFDNSGDPVRFETEDRYFSEKDSTFKKIRWSAEMGFSDRNGIRTPAEVKATWHLPSGDFNYFTGLISDIEFG